MAYARMARVGGLNSMSEMRLFVWVLEAHSVAVLWLSYASHSASKALFRVGMTPLGWWWSRIEARAALRAMEASNGQS